MASAYKFINRILHLEKMRSNLPRSTDIEHACFHRADMSSDEPWEKDQFGRNARGYLRFCYDDKNSRVY